MVETLTLGVVGLAIAVALLAVLLRVTGKSDGQRAKDAAHEQAQQRPPSEAAEKGETYDLVVKETQYDRVPPEVRGTINGLQTFVRDVPAPDGADALGEGDAIRVQVTDYGTQGTTAQARYLGRP
ncbi:MAG: hypothetical protein ACI8UR_001539 [Natronomonas sp.]|jgi:predicted RNA-binding protein with TRAM domain|uniref:hypothetical protein n=1 Tax=Natronomonas sp. TaxID=2184060 RepID=UPI003988D3D1